MKKILIFLGPPGSGKGTQAKKIAAKHGYAHISTGDLFRALAKDENATDKQKQALEEMKSGKLVPDWLVYELAFNAIEQNLAEGRGVVLDGAIRSSEQAGEYQKFFLEKNLQSEVMAVEISISDEESWNRLTKRRVCSQCGEIIPAGAQVSSCPKCGGELVVRADDNEETVKERIQMQGNGAIEPVREFYKNLGEYVMIDGMKTIDAVEKDIEEILSKY